MLLSLSESACLAVPIFMSLVPTVRGLISVYLIHSMRSWLHFLNRGRTCQESERTCLYLSLHLCTHLGRSCLTRCTYLVQPSACRLCTLALLNEPLAAAPGGPRKGLRPRVPCPYSQLGRVPSPSGAEPEAGAGRGGARRSRKGRWPLRPLPLRPTSSSPCPASASRSSTRLARPPLI